MIEAGAEVVETDTFQASRLKLEEWGLGEHTLEINRRAAEIARKAVGEDASSPARSAPPATCPRPTTRRSARSPSASSSPSSTSRRAGCSRAAPTCSSSRPRRTSSRSRPPSSARARRSRRSAARCRSRPASRCCPTAARCCSAPTSARSWPRSRRWRSTCIGLNCSTGPEDMRDAIRFLGELSPVPVHCIPNAGLPAPGPRRRDDLPRGARAAGRRARRVRRALRRDASSAAAAARRPSTSRASSSAARATRSAPRPAPRPPHVSSMIAAAPLVQEPRPTLVGERVNSQGSRKVKELLLADDYDGLVQVAEDQVEGGAHVLDVCVALTERPDEAEQMRQVVKSVSLTQPRADPDRLDRARRDRAALEQIPGRAIVNSINLENGRDKLDAVVPLAIEHGAARDRADDRRGRAWPRRRERKLEIARRIHDIVCDEYGLDPRAADLRRAHLHAHHRRRRVEARRRSRRSRASARIKHELPRVKTSLGVSNVSFGISPGARAVLNSVFLHHCVEAGLDLAIVNPNHITPYGEIPEDERELADDLVFNRREDALERFIAALRGQGRARRPAEVADPTADMEPEEALHWQILHRKKDGVEAWIDAAVEKIGAVPTLNDVLLPAMKEVGDKFGAGELILPFVLQSAEVMKSAVAQLEQLPRQARGLHEGHRRAGHRVRRRARHRQVARQHDPLQQRLHGLRPRQAGPDRHDHRGGRGARRHRDRAVRAARLDLQADAALRPGAAQRGPRVPGADRRRRDQPQLRPARALPGRPASPTRSTSPASSTARTPSRAWP